MDKLKEFVKRNKKWKYRMFGGELRLTYMDDLWFIVYNGNVNGLYEFECLCLLNPECQCNVTFIIPMSEDPDLVNMFLMDELCRWLDRKVVYQ